MRALIISLDKTLLGADYSGDVLERHLAYAQQAGHLEIIVFSRPGLKPNLVSPQLSVYPTNSKTRLNLFFDAWRLAKILTQKQRIDLVITQDPFLTALVGWRIKLKYKIPLLIHFHGDFWQNQYWLWENCYNWFLLGLSKFLVNKADGVRVVSAGIKDKLIQAGIEEKKIRVIPTPVDLDKFKCSASQKKGNVIINVGRHDSSKDYPTLLQAIDLVKKKKKIIFHQIGAGFDKGKINQQELIHYYCQSDIYVSSSCHESFGKVLVEAMACGLPIVATATTGSKEIVTDGLNGFLVPIGDAQALAEKIIFLIENSIQAQIIGQTNQTLVRDKFNQTNIIKNMIKFWEALIEK